MSVLRSRWSDGSMESKLKPAPKRPAAIEDIHESRVSQDTIKQRPSLSEELDYVNIRPGIAPDKASRVLGIQHRTSMEPIPASARNSIVSTRSARPAPPSPSFTPYVPAHFSLHRACLVSGLPKSPHTWTLADPDSVLGLHHTDNAVNRFWRPEVLGSTVSPGAGGGGKKKKRGKDELVKGAGALSKQELSFTREVEVIASTLQPASTVHTFTFTLPAPNTPLAPTSSGDLLRASVLTDNRSSAAPSYAYPYTDDPFVRPSSAYLGPPSLLGHAPPPPRRDQSEPAMPSTVTYHGVCLTVWSHADAERSNAIRRTLEAGRSRKESAQSLVAARLKSLRADAAADDPTAMARRHAKKSSRGPWTDGETDAETDGGGGASESEFEAASMHGPGESTLFLPLGTPSFGSPLVSRHPVYDLMRDYLTLSWARFSKDVQSHTLQISKILAHPAPRAGDLIKLDASPQSGDDGNLEVIARFPGGLDFGRGLVDINFTMWPLFKCMNIDNILTICEIALAPTGRVLFFSRHPAMLGIAVSTVKYLVELRGWNGIALPAVHSRDAKIYVEDPGPWLMGLSTEARYSIRPAPEVCVCDLDINYLSCPSPPPGAVSVKQQRDKYRQKLLAAFEQHYHPDHSVPSEFKEAFPAGRFRPVCKIQAKRGASSAAVAEQIKPPEWWNSTRIIQAFDAVLQDKVKKPSFLKRLSSFGTTKRAPQLTAAEQHIQYSIRKRATAFVDARDDLETKIGRLSRRLNFLMTESDLWRDKFVTFEQYAEKLSAEATQLRTKINKEQKETKRLSGLVTLTAAEKARLQNQLRDTESAHTEAMAELERMRETMEKMEQERAEMVAEVEAQIERALASMAVDIESDFDENDSSRPSSRLSSRPASRLSNSSRPGSRRASDASKRPLRSFATESTLAESYESADLDMERVMPAKLVRETGTIIEADGEEEETPASPNRKKRFSASETDMPQDGMNAVDEGISQKSDRIAQKVLQIQQKLESALAADRRLATRRATVQDSEDDASEATSASTRARPSRPAKSSSRPPSAKTRSRSGTASSAASSGRNSEDTPVYPRTVLIKAAESTGAQTPRNSSDVASRDSQSTPEPSKAPAVVDTSKALPANRAAAATPPPAPPKAAARNAASSPAAAAPASPPPLKVPEVRTSSRASRVRSPVGTTDESDSDFQSAYSQESSPEEPEEAQSPLPSEDFGVFPKTTNVPRDRVFSAATVVGIASGDTPTPTSVEFGDDSIAHAKKP
ncbi:DENN domain-containing protein [Mycena sanguinolenta]|uniref:DENN domain-containing protein n=1 Tax=Mycena sanguinolenta TaxID=230812 RepID=A0A8H7CJ74_9AGAR|nr:DENN domain-containing protein [Mycena sanguinolenta]